jgi:hypothetical protein
MYDQGNTKLSLDAFLLALFSPVLQLPYLYEGEKENRSIFIICHKHSGFFKTPAEKGKVQRGGTA